MMQDDVGWCRRMWDGVDDVGWCRMMWDDVDDVGWCGWWDGAG